RDPRLRRELDGVVIERHDRERVLRAGIAVELHRLIHLEVEPALDRGHEAQLFRRHDHPLALLAVPRHVLLDRVGVVELAVALQGVAHVVQAGPVLLEERAEHARPGVIDPAATQRMRLSVTTRSPLSIRSSPFIETMRAPRSTTDPRGTSRGTRIATSTRSPSYAGSLASESTRAFPTESGFSLVACLSESARVESARALALASESPRAGL